MTRKSKVGMSALVVAMACASAANAADLLPTTKPAAIAPAPVAPSGFYAGAFVGGAFSGLSTTMSSGSTASGFTTGTLLGYKWRVNPWSFGFEGDVSSNSLTQKFSGFAPATAVDNVYSGHARARVGYDIGGFEPFVAGGFAFDRLNQYGQSPNEMIGASSVRPGWTLGAGVDWRVNLPVVGSTILRAEYLYEHLQTGAFNLNGLVFNTGGSVQYLRLGVISELDDRAAHAADNFAANWAGNYVGVFGGYSGARVSTSMPGVSDSFNADGGLVGFYTGRNWMFGNYMLGWDGSTAFASIRGTGPQPLAVGPTHYDDYFVGDLRGRAGYALGRWLPYVAAGVVWDSSEQSDPANATYRGNIAQVSGAVGAGVEYMLTERVALRAEYDYSHSFNSVTTKLDLENCCSQSHSSNTVKFGIGYFFH